MKRMMLLPSLFCAAALQAQALEPAQQVIPPTEPLVPQSEAISPSSEEIDAPEAEMVASELAEAKGPALFPVGIELWMMPRDATSIMHEASVAQAVKALLDEPEAYLEVRYPEGEMGELWGQELQAWLVALGVVSDRIELLQSTAPAEGIVLAVIGAVRNEVEVDLSAPAQVFEAGEVGTSEAVVPAAESSPVVVIEPEAAATDASVSETELE